MSAVERDEPGQIPPLLNDAAWRQMLDEIVERGAGLAEPLRIALRHRLQVAPESFAVREDEVTAAGTTWRRFVVEPAAWFEKLLMALRANNLDAIERFTHTGSFLDH